MPHHHRLRLARLAALPVLLSAPEPAQEAASRSTRLDQAFDRARATARESRWRQIPWRRSLTEAMAEARRTGKPVYCFAVDGDPFTGDC